MPPFDPSAMDGYAVVAGPAAELRVVGESRAGHPGERAASSPERRSGSRPARWSPRERRPCADRARSSGFPGDAARAPRAGSERGGSAGATVRVPETEPGANIRRPRRGRARGRRVDASRARGLEPAAIGSLASIGLAAVRCARRPRVALLVTGDELTPPGQPLAPGGDLQLQRLRARGAGRAGRRARAARRPTVPDSAAGTRAAIERALDGRRRGLHLRRRLGRAARPRQGRSCAALGVEQRFWGVALQPGKPTWFGQRDDVLVFGLPGNPVSAHGHLRALRAPGAGGAAGRRPGRHRARARR